MICGEHKYDTCTKCLYPICSWCWIKGKDEKIYHKQCYTPPTGCFIATACYGSELARPVSFLREFRDGEVITTKIGEKFMHYFNKVYYSFSPFVARFIDKRRYARLLVRYLLVSPLIRLLSVSEYLTRPIKNKEVRVFATGALTVGVIFGVIRLVLYMLGVP